MDVLENGGHRKSKRWILSSFSLLYIFTMRRDIFWIFWSCQDIVIFVGATLLYKVYSDPSPHFVIYFLFFGYLFRFYSLLEKCMNVGYMNDNEYAMLSLILNAYFLYLNLLVIIIIFFYFFIFFYF